MVGIWVLTTFQPITTGITVHVALASRQGGGLYDPWLQAIVVRTDAQHRFYLNSKLISLDRLPSAIAESFRTRANWTVYIEGDPNASYGDVVQAADSVRSAGGRVVLLTANSQQDQPR